MCERFLPLQHARGCKMLSPSVDHSLERSQCMFRSTALDTVISMQVVVGRRLLKYEREARCRGGRPEIELPDLQDMTLQTENTDCASQRCESIVSWFCLLQDDLF